MITDEQYAELRSVIYNNLNVLAGTVELDVIAHTMLEDLSKNQIKQLAESKGMHCGGWIKFDVHDYTTERVLTNIGTVVEKGNYYDNQRYMHEGVTHWQPLPEPPKG